MQCATWLAAAGRSRRLADRLIVPNHELTASMARAPQTAPAPGELRLTAARAQAFIDAHDRQLNYLPGEVLVVQPGAPIDGEQRA
jgi:hypothetical protein